VRSRTSGIEVRDILGLRLRTSGIKVEEIWDPGQGYPGLRLMTSGAEVEDN
jgi:hypothetical protein